MRLVVARHCESVHRLDLNFKRLCHFAKSEDEAYRDRLQHITYSIPSGQERGRSLSQPHVRISKTLPRPQNRVVRRRPSTDGNMLENESIIEHQEYVEAVAKHEEDTPNTTATEVTDPGQQQEEQQELFYSRNQPGQRRRLLPRIQYEEGRTPRVGWIGTRGRKVICHSCYDKSHISPPCQLKLYDLDKVVTNYKVLTTDKRTAVPDTSYKNAKQYFTIKETNYKKEETNYNTEIKN